MTKMLRVLFLTSVLLYSVWASHLKVQIVDPAKDVVEFAGTFEENGIEAVPGICGACKWIVKKVKKSITGSSSKSDIKKKLLASCDSISILKSQCKKFVNKVLDRLVAELSTSDDPKTICTKVKACKPKTPMMDFL